MTGTVARHKLGPLSMLLTAAYAPAIYLLITHGMIASGAVVHLAYLYPVAVNAGLLTSFGATLLNPPSMIERIARAMGDELDERGRRYVRRLTMVWCAFFLANGLIALGTALYGSPKAWALYTGFVSYLLAGALFFGERVVRPAWAKP
jgi:uncharacterized membrane protein